MQDLELLMQVMDSRLQSLATLYSDFHYQGGTEETNTMQNSRLFTLERSGNAGRPRYEIRQEQIHGQREALGFRHRCLDSTDSLPVCRIPFKLYTLKCVSIPYFCKEIVQVLTRSRLERFKSS